MRPGSTLFRLGVIAALLMVARAVLRDHAPRPVPQLAPPDETPSRRRRRERGHA